MPSMINDPDSLRWGQLVKSWVTGLDYIGTPPEQQPPPSTATTAGKPWALPAFSSVSFSATAGGTPVQKTIPGVLCLSKADFMTRLNAAGIPSANFPPATTDVIIVQGDPQTMVLRLPPTAVLQQSEKDLKAGGAYPTPTFYEPLFSPPGGPMVHAKPPTMPDIGGIMRLHANRIGDYSMGLCA
jgi:hypothetical protein